MCFGNFKERPKASLFKRSWRELSVDGIEHWAYLEKLPKFNPFVILTPQTRKETLKHVLSFNSRNAYM